MSVGTDKEILDARSQIEALTRTANFTFDQLLEMTEKSVFQESGYLAGDIAWTFGYLQKTQNEISDQTKRLRELCKNTPAQALRWFAKFALLSSTFYLAGLGLSQALQPLSHPPEVGSMHRTSLSDTAKGVSTFFSVAFLSSMGVGLVGTTRWQGRKGLGLEVDK